MLGGRGAASDDDNGGWGDASTFSYPTQSVARVPIGASTPNSNSSATVSLPLPPSSIALDVVPALEPDAQVGRAVRATLAESTATGAVANVTSKATLAPPPTGAALFSAPSRVLWKTAAATTPTPPDSPEPPQPPF